MNRHPRGGGPSKERGSTLHAAERRNHAELGSIAAMTERLYVLAFDHRTSLMRSFFRVQGEPSDADVERARLAKRVIWEGLARALGGRRVSTDEAAALVDATYGSDAISAAREAGVRIAVPVEASGRRELAFEREDWRDRLHVIQPTWAKVLVRYNPVGDGEMNRRQRQRLRELSELCSDAAFGLMLELLVPPEPSQEGPDYDLVVRPALMVRAIEELREDGVDVDVWKIEGLVRPPDCAAVAWAAKAPCVVLGRGADRGAVDAWLRAGADVPGFIGFAIGRSIWWDALQAFFTKGAPEDGRATAAAAIADEYLRYVEVYRAAQGI
jgi:myo-inositol catabolism protein IolC